MTRLKVKEQPFLYRDVASNGIINMDESAYTEHLRKKRLAERVQEEKFNSEARLNKLETDVLELKSGINQILELLKR
jgi:hypothetical protein